MRNTRRDNFWCKKNIAGVDGDISNEIIKLNEFNNDVIELEINNYDFKNCLNRQHAN